MIAIATIVASSVTLVASCAAVYYARRAKQAADRSAAIARERATGAAR